MEMADEESCCCGCWCEEEACGGAAAACAVRLRCGWRLFSLVSSRRSVVRLPRCELLTPIHLTNGHSCCLT